MSLSFGAMIQERSEDRSALYVCLGMLVAAALIIALSASFGMATPDPATIPVGP